MATQQEYLAAIQRERDANARAQAEGYESAAHKESHANVGAQAAGFSDAAAYERDADIRAQAAGFDSAVAQEMDANRRSKEAGFTSAVDQEIDANRRAREAGYLNAADYESGLRTRSDAPFLDPRLQPAPVIPEKFALGTANLLKYNPDQPNVPGYNPNWRNDPKYASGFDVHGNPITGGGGPPNPTVPSFGYPQYQDWTRFMPTNFQLAEGGGMHYQPGAVPGTGGGGTAIGAGNNIWSTGTATGGTTATGGPGPINPNIWGNTGTTTGGNTTTDASGNQWVMSSDGQWVPADSEWGQGLLGKARLFPAQQYDSSGNYLGFEGADLVNNPNINPSSFQDKWGNTVKTGFSSFSNMLKGISIADETAAKRLAESGAQGVVDPTAELGTPASSGQGVTFDPSGNPFAL